MQINIDEQIKRIAKAYAHLCHIPIIGPSMGADFARIAIKEMQRDIINKSDTAEG